MADLLVDLGNTRLKLAWLDNDLLDLGTIVDFSGIAQSIPGHPERVWISSVANGTRTKELIQALTSTGGRLVRVGIEQFQRHLPTRYEITQLGVDRWLAALAGYDYAKGSCVVVDAGTATTIELVDGRGLHLGGYILPGETLMVQAIEDATTIQVPRSETVCGEEVPFDTAGAIHCGSLAAQAALIERSCELMGPDAALLIGGGNASELVPLLNREYQHVQQLVLEGLARLARLELTCAG